MRPRFDRLFNHALERTRGDQRSQQQQAADQRGQLDGLLSGAEFSDRPSPATSSPATDWIAANAAEVDRSTYLPVVNGRTLRQLSSGGMKTTTNVAYYLANVAMAVRDRQILTPSFMMLDSIRKASGAERDDLVRAEHIYSYPANTPRQP